MGTLYNQSPRYEARNIPGRQSDWLLYVMDDIEDLKKKHGLSTGEALEVVKIAHERERLTYWKNDLDVRDEQFGGFGELLSTLVSAIGRAVEAYTSR